MNTKQDACNIDAKIEPSPKYSDGFGNDVGPFHAVEMWNTAIRKRQSNAHDVLLAVQGHNDVLENVDSKKPCQRKFWYVIISLLVLIGLLHMAVLMYTALRSQTNVNIAFKSHAGLYMPRIHVCQGLTNMLDPAKLANVTITPEEFYAMEVGVGLTLPRHKLSPFWYQSLDLNLLKEEYGKAIQKHGSIVNAYRTFFEKYAFTCNDLFRYCEWFPLAPSEPAPSCCDVFEPVFTVDHYCFVSRENSVKIESLDTMGEFVFAMQYPGSEAAYNFSFIVDNEQLFTGGSYIFGVSDDLHQTASQYWKFNGIAKYGVENVISLVQEHREMLSNNENCVEKTPSLRYFKEYSISNCQWEQTFVNHLHLITGKSCDLPIFQLTNPEFHSDNLCGIDDILQLLDLKLEFTEMINLNNLSDESLRFLTDKCDVDGEFGNQSTVLPACTMELLSKMDERPDELQQQVNRIIDLDVLSEQAHIYPANYLKSLLEDKCNVYEWKHSPLPNCTRDVFLTVNRQLNGYFGNLRRFARFHRNSDPLTLISLFINVRKHMAENNADNDTVPHPACLPACTSSSHSVSIRSTKVDETTVTVTSVRFSTSEVAHVTEVLRLDWSEYLSMVGGIVSMWTGASILSLANLIFILARILQCKIAN